MIDAIEINAMNLYSLSNYEKGRLCTSKLLSAQEKIKSISRDDVNDFVRIGTQK